MQELLEQAPRQCTSSKLLDLTISCSCHNKDTVKQQANIPGEQRRKGVDPSMGPALAREAKARAWAPVVADFDLRLIYNCI